MKNIAIITARSGSKGLKDKNIKELCGVPMIVYSIRAAVGSNMFEEVMVSTDSEKYAKIAIENGAKVPFYRSEKTSSDTAGSWDVVKEVLLNYANKGNYYETVCLLQPTSPLRTSEDICNGYKLMLNKNADAVTSVCEIEHSPLWCMTLSDSLSLKEYREKSGFDKRRQELEQYYRINGALYIRKLKYLDNTVFFQNSNEVAYIMSKKNSVDIDSLEDFELAEFYLNKSN